MKNYSLDKSSGDWALRQSGSQRASESYGNATKAEALRQAAAHLRSQPEPASLKVKNLNGRIQEERTYPRSADPKRSPG